MISYYRGAPPNAFPKMKFKIVKCNMEDFQYKSYLTALSEDTNKGFKNADILDLPLNFLLAPRFISNISFPNKSIGDKGFYSFNKSNMHCKNIKKYSKEFYKIFNNIRKSEGPVFVYSNFKILEV